MDVFLNEKCLSERTDFNEILLLLRNNLSHLHSSKTKIYTRLNSFKNWSEEWDEYFDRTLLNYFTQLLLYLEESPSNSRQHYYYHFIHQDFTLSLTDDVFDTSIASACDKILNGHQTLVLNIPVSKYCSRPYIPVVRSSHDKNNKDEIANIPSYNNSISVLNYILLNEKIKSLLEDAEFEKFKSEFWAFKNNFDSTTWSPKVFCDEQILSPINAFPASSKEYIRKTISVWEVENGTTEDSIANRKKLGNLVLEIHGYSKNPHLSTYYQRDIFEAGFGNHKLLVSLDLENGAFEVIESNGTHIGVYGYAGNYIKHYTEQEDINLHSLERIPRSMFMFQ